MPNNFIIPIYDSPPPTIKDADILLKGSPDLFSQLIRWFQNEPHDPAPFNHMGLLFNMTIERAYYLARARKCDFPPQKGPWVAEARWKITVTNFLEFLDDPRNTLAILRDEGMGQLHRLFAVQRALSRVGYLYSPTKLLLWGIDCAIGTNMAVKLAPRKMVCSTYGADCLCRSKRSWDGEHDPRNVRPDNFWDEARRPGSKVKIIWARGPING